MEVPRGLLPFAWKHFPANTTGMNTACILPILLHRKQQLMLSLQASHWQLAPRPTINGQTKEIIDLLNLLTQSIELIAQGWSRNTRVQAGSLTRILVPGVRQSCCTADAYRTSEHNPTYLFLVASWEGFGRRNVISLCSPVKQHRGRTCFPLQTRGPRKLSYLPTHCSAFPGSQNNPPGGVLPSGRTKTPRFASLPGADLSSNRPWGISMLSPDISQPFPTGIVQKAAKALIPKGAMFACAQAFSAYRWGTMRRTL